METGRRLGVRGGTGRLTGVAAHRSSDRHLLGDPLDRVDQVEFGNDLEIDSSVRGRSGTVPSHVEECVEEVAEPAAAEGITHGRAVGRAVLVVARPFLLIAEHLVGLGNLLELGFGGWVTRIGVGVQLAGPLAVGLLDLVLAGRAAHTEEIVEVSHEGTRSFLWRDSRSVVGA